MKLYLDPATATVCEFQHELKTWPDMFDEIDRHRKVHEFRKNDRNFREGDLVLLREFEPAGERYTGREIPVRIMSISYGPAWGIPKGYAAFSIAVGRSVDIRGHHESE